MIFSANPTDRHQGCDASTVIGQPISAGGGRLCGPSAGVGLPGGWRAADPHVGSPGSRDGCTANGIARREYGLHLHRRAWICPGQRRRRRTRMPRQLAAAREVWLIGACVHREQGSPLHRQAWTPDRDEHRGRQACETGQSAIATDVRPTRSRAASKGFAFSRKSAMYSRGSGAAGGNSTLSGSRWTPRTRNS